MGGTDYPVVYACLGLAGSAMRPHLLGERAPPFPGL